MPSREDQAFALGEALFLVGLFSDCIESMSLIHATHEGSHSEELLMAQLEIQKNRLLIWGDIVGISSPPASTGITQAIPLHPGDYNPEPDRPVNFGPRDARLEDRNERHLVKEALEGIVEPIRFSNRHTMLLMYGLDTYHPPHTHSEDDGHEAFRLQGFREKHTLLRDVSQSFPNVPHRKHTPPKQSWAIADQAKFALLLTLIRENVDYLIKTFAVQARVDRSMKLDIRAMGWHPSEDMSRISRNTWKLSLLNQASEVLYPEYSDAAQEALDNIMDQWKGTQGYLPRPDHLNPLIETAILHSPSQSRAPSPERYPVKKGGLLSIRPKIIRMFSGKSPSGTSSPKGYTASKPDPMALHRALAAASAKHKSGSSSPNSKSGESTPSRPTGPSRTHSLLGGRSGHEEYSDPPRSNSIHGDDDLTRQRTYESLSDVLERTETLTSQISRHDMYKGVFRVSSKRGRKA